MLYLVLGAGEANDYGTVLTNPTQHFSKLDESTSGNNLKISVDNIINRITASPRQIVNTDCRETTDTITYSTTYYVENRGIVRYRLSPYYFYFGGDNKKIKIQEMSTGELRVCSSRTNEAPDENGAGTCVTLKANETSIELTTGDSYGETDPLYLSVQGVNYTSASICDSMLKSFFLI